MTVLEMSLGGGLLIAVILVLRRRLLYCLPKWTFLLLWAVALCRLLIPFTVPSQLSVHTGAAWVVQFFEEERASDPFFEAQIPVEQPPSSPSGTPHETIPIAPDFSTTALLLEAKPVSPLNVIYVTGMALCGLFFAAACLWSLRRFQNAVPAKSDFICHWQKAHPTLFHVQIKTSEAVNAPLAYGLLQPVVLLPENTDLANENQLTYLLTHEYVHIRRGDLFWKLLLSIALCVHWFNPLVWVMYLRANRDLELACDERVVRILGLDNKKGYAYALLAVAESGFSPLCITYTTKNYMEERIIAIMKIKKTSIAAILAAAMLVTGVSTVFATSKADEPKNLDDLPQTIQSQTVQSYTNKDSESKDLDNLSQTVQPHTDKIPEQRKPDGLSQAVQSNPLPSNDEAVPVSGDKTVVGEIEPAPAQSTSLAMENRWGVPDGEIPRWTEFIVDSFEDAAELGKYLEEAHGLYPGDYTAGMRNGTGTVFLQVHYREKAIHDRLPDNVYPVNSKGETYGCIYDSEVVGYAPDLITVEATNGVVGYALYSDLHNDGYQGPMNTPEDMAAYSEWKEDQPPRQIPVYDVNRDNVIGYFLISSSRYSNMTQEEKLEMIAAQADQQ